jgi:CheY-like chemotaxis protein
MPTILVLEDDEDRAAAMKQVLAERFGQYKRVFFDNAPETIAWLKENLRETALICLDHDLGPNRHLGDDVFDPGTGRDVVDYLASQIPHCPVVMHTTNDWAAPGMEMALKDVGWKCSRVIPSTDLKWVETIWFRQVSKFIPSG